MPEPKPIAVVAVLRALALLDAFRVDDERLGLADLARRAAVPKTTAFRLAHTLESAGYLVRLDGGAWRLGPATARLAARYQTAFDLHSVIEPALRQLARTTGESASFFAHDGNQRIRLGRVHGTHAFASTTRVGEPLPLDRGSPGKVILAATGRPGAPYDRIRAAGYSATVAEAQPGVASLAAVVHGPKRAVIGAICISMTAERASADATALERHAGTVMKAARRLSALLASSGNDAIVADLARSDGGPPTRARWHP